MAELDPRQMSAVNAGPVDVFIAAGAGSGKTRVLSARFVNAVLGTEPYEACGTDELLAVTFTEKAAGELAERIRGALSAAGEPSAARAVGDAWISTIHGMCSRILRRHALTLGIDPQFRVLDDVEASALQARAVDEVVNASLAEDEFAALLDAYRFEDVVAAAMSVTGKMHALGLPVADLGTVPEEAALRDLEDAVCELERLSLEFTRLRRIKTVEDDESAIRSLIGAVREIGQAGGAGLLLDSALSCKLRRVHSVDGMCGLVDECEQQVERVRRAAAQLLVGALERAFLTFAIAFESRYAELKESAGVLDFEDLQLQTARLLESYPRIADRYRRRFSMLMLDEFQDTNALQMRIVEQLSSGNLCTVGDENQSIYSFRHADVGVFRERERVASHKTELDINYRTAPPLLDAINALFARPSLLGHRYMPLRAPRESDVASVWPASQPRFEARFIDTSSSDGGDPQVVEAERIADRVDELLADGAQPGDIAILMRALSGGRAARVESSLMARGIPVYIASGGSFFERPEIIEARALLRTIANVWDDSALAVVLAGRLTGLSTDALITLRSHADAMAAARECRTDEVHLWDAAISPTLVLATRDTNALRRTVDVIESARSRRGVRALSATVLQPLVALDADLVMFASGRGGERAWSNVLKLARIADEYESGTGGELGGFLEYLDLREAHATSEQEATLDGETGAVRVMSIHASKGLEFPAVIVGGLSSPQERGPFVFARVDGRPLLGMTLPHGDGAAQTMGSQRTLAAVAAAAEAEAVRLLYVACTRAEESLTLIAKTDVGKESGSSLGELVRDALGFSAADSLEDSEIPLGETIARVRVVSASLGEDVATPPTHPEVAEEAPRSAPPTPAHAAAESHEPAIPRQVSYTALATYARCPYRFYLTSVMRLPAPPAAQGGEALAFGSAVHSVLERCTSANVDVPALVAEASRAASLDPQAAARLAEAVDAYLSSPEALEVFSADRVMREAPIAVPLHGTLLAGAIDLIAWRGDEALVVDYKTGTAPLSDEQARQLYRLQGQCYALAAFRAGATSVRVVFAELERRRSTEYSYRRDDEAATERDVAAIIATMSEEGFEVHASYEAQLCETCPGLGGLCPVSRPTRGGAG